MRHRFDAVRCCRIVHHRVYTVVNIFFVNSYFSWQLGTGYHNMGVGLTELGYLGDDLSGILEHVRI